MKKLPLLDGSIDAVVVNGVLEWVGLSDSVTPPRQLQIQFLLEILRVLKPGGKLLIGIENRTGAQFFVGGRDHSGLRFTSLMPRWLASLVVRSFRRMKSASHFSGAETSYRTLTYTYWGYCDILKQVGFGDPDLYWTWPDYSFPKVSGSLDGDSIGYYLRTVENHTGSRWKKTALKALRLAPTPLLGLLIKAFAPHFLIVASKANAAGGLQEAILNSRDHPSFLRTTLNSEVSLKTSYLLLDNRGIKERFEIVPVREDGHLQFAVEEKAGVQGRPIRLDSAEEVGQVGSWLAGFQAGQSNGSWAPAELEAELQRLLSTAKHHATGGGLLALLDEFARQFLAAASTVSLPVVVEHGDFTPGNILVNPQGMITVTGWESFIARRQPVDGRGRLLPGAPEKRIRRESLSHPDHPGNPYSPVRGRILPERQPPDPVLPGIFCFERSWTAKLGKRRSAQGII